MSDMPRIDAQVHIETPENVWLSFRLAGPGSRLGAFMLDLLIRVAVLFVVAQVVGVLAAFDSTSGLHVGLMLLTMFLLEWGYGCVFETLWDGRTLGKWMIGLRVIKEGGYPISFYDALLRNLLRAADILPIFYGVGFLCMLMTRRMQRLGDLLAGTIVVIEQRAELRGELPLLRTVPPLAPSQFTHLYRPSEKTLDLLEKYFLRCRTLPVARAEEIAMILAQPLAERLGYTTADPAEDRSPSRFLLRVLRTFAARERSAAGPAPADTPAEAPAA
jgi:uncharacterized RDD family membrane protein YckC